MLEQGLVFGVDEGVVVFAVVEAFDEVPEGLSRHVGGLMAVVVERVELEDAEAVGLVAHTGIAHHLAQLFAVEAVRHGVAVGWGVALAHGTEIDGEEVGVADEGFGTFHVVLHLAEAVGVELEVVHELYVWLSYKVCLISDVGMEEEVVGI